jgi:hypothetical protein
VQWRVGTQLTLTLNSIQTDRVKEQVDLVHGMLGDIHEWYLRNLKDVPTRPENSKTVDSGIAAYSAIPTNQSRKPDLSFSVILDPSNELLCPKAAFNQEWLRTQGTRILDCLCGNNDELDYTCKIQINNRKLREAKEN